MARVWEWDTDTNPTVHIQEDVASVSWSPDGTRLVTAHADGSLGIAVVSTLRFNTGPAPHVGAGRGHPAKPLALQLMQDNPQWSNQTVADSLWKNGYVGRLPTRVSIGKWRKEAAGIQNPGAAASDKRQRA